MNLRGLFDIGWCKHNMAETKNHDRCSVHDPQAAAWCLYGGIEKLYPDVKKEAVAWAQEEIIRRGLFHHNKWIVELIPTFNDDVGTTKEMAQEVADYVDRMAADISVQGRLHTASFKVGEAARKVEELTVETCRVIEDPDAPHDVMREVADRLVTAELELEKAEAAYMEARERMDKLQEQIRHGEQRDELP